MKRVDTIDDILQVGLDFGTAKTAVSCSNGRRAVVASGVGWPKEPGGYDRVECQVFFGKRAIRRHEDARIVRPFDRRGQDRTTSPLEATRRAAIARRSEAARLLVRHLLAEVNPERHRPVHAMITASDVASLGSIRWVCRALVSTLDAVMVAPCPLPVAVRANGLIDTLVIDLGSGTVDVACGRGEMLKPSEVDSILLPDAIHGRNAQDEDYRAVLPEIAQAVARRLQPCSPRQRTALLRNTLLCGGGSQLSEFPEWLVEALAPLGEVVFQRVYDETFAAAQGALCLARDIPSERWTPFLSRLPRKAA